MNMKRRIKTPLSLEERKTIEELLKLKLNGKQISLHLHRSKTVINAEIKRNSKPYNAEKAHEESKLRWQERSKKLTRIFDDNERAMINEMLDNQESLNSIAKHLHCNTTKLNYFLQITRNKPKYSIPRRLANLEQQIEIIFQTLKELRSGND